MNNTFPGSTKLQILLHKSAQNGGEFLKIEKHNASISLLDYESPKKDKNTK